MMPLPEWVYDMLDGFSPQPDPDDDWTEVEVEQDAPRCCGQDMEFVRFSKRDNEIWECPRCGMVEVFPMLAYTHDSIRLNEEQYAEYSAWRKQMDYLKRRYGTYRPTSIADYWIRGTA